MTAYEVNFDGLIGPTHNYGGLSDGNLASANNAGDVSAPREAALQGLEKMRLMVRSGLKQGFLPPHPRPARQLFEWAGFPGPVNAHIASMVEQAPELLKNAYSASPMWTANAATVSPSADTKDGKLHLTPANLSSMLHRSLEAPVTFRTLHRIFADQNRFAVHQPLPHGTHWSDEGAANHARLCASHEGEGVEIFVYGREAFERSTDGFPARQTLLASQSIARAHGLTENRTVFVRQSKRAIDAGAFHNDVVSVGSLDTLFYHEHAFDDTEAALAAIRSACEGLFTPKFVEVPDAEVPLKDAIKSYLFNSQLIDWPGEDRLVLVAPTETRDTSTTKAYCDRLVQGNGPIGRVQYVDVRQSMRNGGGPACLRLRVVMTDVELAACNPAFLLDEAKIDALQDWVRDHYREALTPDVLADSAFAQEIETAMAALEALLQSWEK